MYQNIFLTQCDTLTRRRSGSSFSTMTDRNLIRAAPYGHATRALAVQICQSAIPAGFWRGPVLRCRGVPAEWLGIAYASGVKRYPRASVEPSGVANLARPVFTGPVPHLPASGIPPRRPDVADVVEMLGFELLPRRRACGDRVIRDLRQIRLLHRRRAVPRFGTFCAAPRRHAYWRPAASGVLAPRSLTASDQTRRVVGGG